MQRPEAGQNAVILLAASTHRQYVVAKQSDPPMDRAIADDFDMLRLERVGKAETANLENQREKKRSKDGFLRLRPMNGICLRSEIQPAVLSKEQFRRFLDEEFTF